MALADIINRIESDATGESELELSAASARAEELLESARSEAKSSHSRMIESARRDSTLRAATLLAVARLAARDRALAEKRALVASALEGVVEAIESLPADRYVRLLASGIARAARSGDTVALAAADAEHAEPLRAAVEDEAPDLVIGWAPTPAPLPRGAVLSGPRSRVEVTPAAVVAERWDEVELAIAAELFSGEER